MKRILYLLIAVLAISCTKTDPIDDFEKVRVTQAGELIIVDGWLERPPENKWRYNVAVVFKCEDGTITTKEYYLNFEPGRTYTFLEDQNSCKLIGWKLTYDDILRQ